jgi:hypothetical protein
VPTLLEPRPADPEALQVFPIGDPGKQRAAAERLARALGWR